MVRITSYLLRITDRRLWPWYVAIVLGSVLLSWYGSAYGLLLTDDSYQYLSAAKSFARQGDFRSPDGSYYSYWPPLFPIIISLFADPIDELRYLFTVAQLVIAFTLLVITREFLSNGIGRLIFFGACMLNVQFIRLCVFLHSDLIFMMLAWLASYLVMKSDRKIYFNLFLIAGFLLCIQRNAGLFWITGICAWLLLKQEWSVSNVLRTTLIWVVTTLGLWAWNVYNTFFIPADFSFYNHTFFSHLSFKHCRNL